MIIKTCDLIGIYLDLVVASLEGVDVDEGSNISDEHGNPYGCFDEDGNEYPSYSPSRNWEAAGYIIERENIAITGTSFPWFATEYGWWGHIGDVHVNGPTPLVAAMRCYVATKLGLEIDMDKIYEKLQIEIGVEDKSRNR